jgi:hypothetical protein
MRIRRRAATIALAAAGAAALVAQAPTVLRLGGLNKTYQDVAGEIPPIEMGPVVVRLSSPRQALVLEENRLRLTPLGGGRFRGTAELDVRGEGDLVADVDLGGAPRRITDEVEVPRQTVTVAGVVRLARAEGGYRVVAEELPAETRVAIRSRAVGSILDLCAGASLLTLGSLDCEPLSQALENPRVPLPPKGSEFRLEDADLTAEDRAALDALLAGDGTPAREGV